MQNIKEVINNGLEIWQPIEDNHLWLRSSELTTLYNSVHYSVCVDMPGELKKNYSSVNVDLSSVKIQNVHVVELDLLQVLQHEPEQNFNPHNSHM